MQPQGIDPGFAYNPGKLNVRTAEQQRVELEKTEQLQQAKQATKVASETPPVFANAKRSVFATGKIDGAAFNKALLALKGSQNTRRQLAEFIDKQTKEIIDMNKQREKLMVELESQNEELNNYAYLVSHDLKSPLRNIIAFSSLINEPSNSPEDLKEYTGLVVSNAKKMSELISSLLAHSKIGYAPSEMEKVSLNEILDAAKNNLLEEIKSKETLIIHEELPQVLGNEILLVQLFQNLISNAIKYNVKDVVKIEISAYQEREQTIIKVKDNGIGIPTNKISEIFKAFSRAHSASLYEGNGIGLATCDKIMKIHSGEISVESTEYEGSTFVLSFPIVN